MARPTAAGANARERRAAGLEQPVATARRGSPRSSSAPPDRGPQVAFGPCPSPTTSRPCVDALPPDWSQLEADLRIDDEDRYIEAATLLSQVNAMPYSQHDWHWRLRSAREFGHAAAPQTVRGTLALLDDQGITGHARAARGALRPRGGHADVGPSRVGAPGVRPPPRAVAPRWRASRCICPDLLFGSKLRGALAAAGHEVVAPDDPADLQVVDLTADADERLGEARIGELPTLAFYSHVEVDVRRKAEAAGVDRVVPRSRMARETVALVEAPSALGRRERAREVRRAARGSRSARRSAPRPPAPPGRRRSGRPERGGERVELRSHHLLVLAGGPAPPPSTAVGGCESASRVPSRSAASVSRTSSGSPLERGPRGGHHELRVARRSVAVDAELGRVDAAPAQRHALGVPERHDGVHPPGDQARHRREADRHAPDVAERRPVVLQHGPRAPRRRRAGRSRPRACRRARAAASCRRARSPRPGAAGQGRPRPPGPGRARGPAPGRGCPPPPGPPGPRRAA